MSKRHQLRLNRQSTRRESNNGFRIYLGDRLEATYHGKNEDLHAIVVLEMTWQLRNLRKLRIDT